jgi:hypothetical protein
LRKPQASSTGGGTIGVRPQDESGGNLANLGNLPAQQAAMLIDVTLFGVTLGGM